MARALVGHLGSTPNTILLVELTALRRRVRELEDELAAAKAAPGLNGGLDAGLPADLDIELHRITAEADPVLA